MKLRNEITSSKTLHQKNVTKIFHFQAPPFAKSWLRSFPPPIPNANSWLRHCVNLVENTLSSHSNENFFWEHTLSTKKKTGSKPI